MAGKSNPTIKDIAKAANVSIATVSRVLNDRGGDIAISEQTKTRVLDHARELGYSANLFATKLRGGRAGVIGAIVRDIADPFLTELTKEVELATWQRGWNILVGHAQFDEVLARRHVDFMLNGLFDGLILLGSMVDVFDLLDRVSQKQMPAISIASRPSADIPGIQVDDLMGMQLAVDHLLELGHQRIAFVGSLDLPAVEDRLNTAREKLARAGFDLPDDYVRSVPNIRSRVIEVTMDFLDRPLRPTAILCSSDNVALGVISAALRCGLSVPRDLSVVGFDDLPEASMSNPPLTTIRQPFDEMAESAIAQLSRLIEGSEVISRQTSVNPQLVVRKTTSRPRT